jgi:hypothetical protein
LVNFMKHTSKKQLQIFWKLEKWKHFTAYCM